MQQQKPRESSERKPEPLDALLYPLIEGINL